MVAESIVDTVVAFVFVVGVPVLVVLFFAEGLVVGKVLQPPTVFVTVVALSTPSWPLLAALVAGCTLSVTAGQWTLYRGFDPDASELVGLRRRVPYLARVPTTVVDRIGERRYRIIDRLFARFGAASILVSTFTPGIRGLIAIPAGFSSYPTARFLVVTAVSNLLYFVVLSAVAFGIVELLT